MGRDKMPQTPRITRSINNGCLINNNGKPLFIKQPHLVELNILYQAMMTNMKTVTTIFSCFKKINNNKLYT